MVGVDPKARESGVRNNNPNTARAAPINKAKKKPVKKKVKKKRTQK